MYNFRFLVNKVTNNGHFIYLSLKKKNCDWLTRRERHKTEMQRCQGQRNATSLREWEEIKIFKNCSFPTKKLIFFFWRKIVLFLSFIKKNTFYCQYFSAVVLLFLYLNYFLCNLNVYKNIFSMHGGILDVYFWRFSKKYTKKNNNLKFFVKITKG